MNMELAEEVYKSLVAAIKNDTITDENLSGIKRILKAEITTYKKFYEYYKTKDNLIQHRKYTSDMRKSLKRGIERLQLDEDDIYTIIDRHSKIVDMTKDKGMYAVKPRRFDVLFGQRDVEKTHLLCSEYLDDGGKYKMYLKDNTEGTKREKVKYVSNAPDNF